MSFSLAMPGRRDGWSWRRYWSLAAVGELAYLAVLMAIAGVLGPHVEALRAAGLAGGPAIGGVAGFFSALKSDLVWLGVTVVGFAIVLIAILFLSEHSRAHDIALKVGIGVFCSWRRPGSWRRSEPR
jgi:hypothetical protein